MLFQTHKRLRLDVSLVDSNQTLFAFLFEGKLVNLGTFNSQSVMGHAVKRGQNMSYKI